jgi:hypothetical protein
MMINKRAILMKLSEQLRQQLLNIRALPTTKPATLLGGMLPQRTILMSYAGEPIVDAHIKQLAQMASESNDSFSFMIFQNLIFVAMSVFDVGSTAHITLNKVLGKQALGILSKMEIRTFEGATDEALVGREWQVYRDGNPYKAKVVHADENGSFTVRFTKDNHFVIRTMNRDDLSNLVRTTTSREQLLSADSSSLEGTTWEDSSCSGLLQSTHGMDSTSSANVVADDFLHFGLDSSKSLMLQGCVHEKFHVYKG